MKIVKQRGNSQAEIEDAPVPTPGRDEVLIKTVASALCGSEMHGYRKEGVATGNSGHEAVGIVVALGAEVEAPAVGQRVGVSAIAGCGHCDYCLKGQYTWCERLRFYGQMHAEYFVVAATACHLLPDDVSWDSGVLITGDGLGVPYHTSTKLCSDEIATIAVFGLGPVGLGNILLQSYLGRTVIGIDRSPERLNLATQMGATHVIAAEKDTDVSASVRGLTKERGADVCIEAAGVPATVRHCFNSVRKGGTVVFNGEQGALELSPSEDFIRRDITAFGSWFYHFCEYPAMLALLRQGLPVSSLITHRFSLEEAPEAYRAMAEGRSGKVLLQYNAT